MRRKWSLSVSQRITASFVSILVILAANGALSFVMMGNQSDNASRISGVWMTNMQTILDINNTNQRLLTIQYKMLQQTEELQRNKLKTEGEEAIAHLKELFGNYKTDYTGTDDAGLFSSLRTQSDIYLDGYAKLMKAVEDDGDERTRNNAIRNSEGSFNALSTYTDTLIWQNEKGAQEASASSASLKRQGTIAIGAGLAAAILLIVGLLYYIRKTVSVPLKKTSEVIARVAEGDLSVRVPDVRTRDEIGVLVGALAGMIGMMREALRRMQDAASSVSASAEELLAASQENAGAAEQADGMVREAAAGAANQLGSFEEIGRSTEEMAVGVQRIAESSSLVSELSIDAASQSRAGGETMERASAAMNAIRDAVNRAAGQVERLEGHMSGIGKITEMIGDISKQTNLLALNASIEAARAGEHGKGFAVVAEEVRKLSGQTAESVSEIAAAIARIKEDTAETAQSMRLSREETMKGLAGVGEAAEAFRRIAEASGVVSAKIEEVAAAAEQLAASSEEVSASVLQVTDIARRTSDISKAVAETAGKQTASASEIASSAGGLTEIAQNMNEVAASFRL